MSDEQGQATFEYVLLLSAFAITLAVMGALWRAAQDGALSRHVRESASHTLEGGLVTSLQDVLLY